MRKNKNVSFFYRFYLKSLNMKVMFLIQEDANPVKPNMSSSGINNRQDLYSLYLVKRKNLRIL